MAKKTKSDVPELSKLFPFGGKGKKKVADAVAKSPQKRTAKEKAMVKAAVAKTNGDDLSDPSHVLNRTNGKTKAQIEAERDALIARDKARSTTQHRILTGGDAPRATLTDADKKAIAELESGQAQRKEIATANRIGKLKASKSGATTAMPLTGKAALSVIAQSATQEFVAKGGKIKHSSDDKQETKMSAKQKTVAKKAKATKTQKSAARSERLEKLIAAMKKNGGLTNETMVKLIGTRMSAATIRLACEARGIKGFKVDKKDGEPAHYVIRNGK